MDREDFVPMIILVVTIAGVCGFTYCVLEGLAIDYSEECMREMAVNHCESEGMYFNRYFSGTVDNEYFYCREDGRGKMNTRLDYSSEEMDNCRIKDANSFKVYESKWELDALVGNSVAGGGE